MGSARGLSHFFSRSPSRHRGPKTPPGVEPDSSDFANRRRTLRPGVRNLISHAVFVERLTSHACPRRESNPVRDLRRVACLRHTPRTSPARRDSPGRTQSPPPRIRTSPGRSVDGRASTTPAGNARTRIANHREHRYAARGTSVRIRTPCGGFGIRPLSQEHTRSCGITPARSAEGRGFEPRSPGGEPR